MIKLKVYKKIKGGYKELPIYTALEKGYISIEENGELKYDKLKYSVVRYINKKDFYGNDLIEGDVVLINGDKWIIMYYLPESCFVFMNIRTKEIEYISQELLVVREGSYLETEKPNRKYFAYIVGNDEDDFHLSFIMSHSYQNF